MRTHALLLQLTIREIRSRFVGSASGWIWLVLTPLLLLTVYGFVFGVIFQARVPAGLEIPFIAWLAVALWPWLAFSEGLLRGSQAIVQHSALISKVSLPRELLVVSSITAVYVLHLVGYLVVLIALQWRGIPIYWSGIPVLLLTLLTLYFLTLGMGMALAAIQVFVRDLEQALPTLILFWFFLTPILYAPEMLPGHMAEWLKFNPMSWWMAEIRDVLLAGDGLPGIRLLILAVASALVLAFGVWLFRRLSPHFEDFL